MRLTAILCTAALLAIALSSGVAADTGEAAVVDRLESGQAVLLIESEGETIDERVVDVGALPTEGRHEGAVLRIVDGGYVYDEAVTDRRTSEAGDTFDRLADSDEGQHQPRRGLSVRTARRPLVVLMRARICGSIPGGLGTRDPDRTLRGWTRDRRRTLRGKAAPRAAFRTGRG